MDKTLTTKRHQKLIELLVRAREDAKLTQAEFAKALGEYQSFVARLQSGQRRFDVVEIVQIAEVLDSDPGTILAKMKAVKE